MSNEPVWTSTSGAVCIYDEMVSKAPISMHDASRPFVVMYRERLGYQHGGTAWRLDGRYESLMQAKRRAYTL